MDVFDRTLLDSLFGLLLLFGLLVHELLKIHDLGDWWSGMRSDEYQVKSHGLGFCYSLLTRHHTKQP